MNNKRGYFGLAFYEPKFEENIGMAIRSAKCFNADFIAIIGKRYKKQVTNTTLTERHIPLYEYRNLEDFLDHIPFGCEIVGIEIDGRNIKGYIHPERAVYILGGEDRMLPSEIKQRIKIDTQHCLNMSVAASIILFHRSL